jgi:membrane protease YdiL (CAAX protease family)
VSEAAIPPPAAEYDRAGLGWLGAAVLAAPLYWLAQYLLRPVAIDLTWPLTRPWVFLLPAFVYPVLEELCFRGLLQGALRERAWGLRHWCGITLANICTALAFAAAHGLTRGMVHAAAVFAPGLIFGFFRDRFGNVGPSIALHVLYNAGWFWLFGAGLAI